MTNEKLTPAAEAFREEIASLFPKYGKADDPSGLYVAWQAVRLFDAREREHQEEIERLKSAPRCGVCRDTAYHDVWTSVQGEAISSRPCHACDAGKLIRAHEQEISHLKREHVAEVERLRAQANRFRETGEQFERMEEILRSLASTVIEEAAKVARWKRIMDAMRGYVDTPPFGEEVAEEIRALGKEK